MGSTYAPKSYAVRESRRIPIPRLPSIDFFSVHRMMKSRVGHRDLDVELETMSSVELATQIRGNGAASTGSASRKSPKRLSPTLSKEALSILVVIKVMQSEEG